MSLSLWIRMGISFNSQHNLEKKIATFLPSLWSEVEHESMKVWATTDRQESTMFDLWMSNTKLGFLMRFTQNLRGKTRQKREVRFKLTSKSLGCFWSYRNGKLLLFQVCTTSGSVMPCKRAWSSRKSNMYFIASGSAEPRCAVLKIVSNRSSTNFWRVPCNEEWMDGMWLVHAERAEHCRSHNHFWIEC